MLLEYRISKQHLTVITECKASEANNKQASKLKIFYWEHKFQN